MDKRVFYNYKNIKKIALVLTILFIFVAAGSQNVKNTIKAEGTSIINENTGAAYSTLTAAFNDVGDGDGVTLIAQGDFEESITLNKNAQITLKAGQEGCKITGSFSVNSGRLILDGLNINGSVTYAGDSSSGSVKDCNITTTGSGIVVNGNAVVDEILRVNISGGSKGIMVGPGGYVKNIDGGENKSSITATMQGIGIDVFDNRSGHSNGAKVDRIANYVISSTGSNPSYTSQYGGIVLRSYEKNAGIEVGTIENCEMSAASDNHFHGGIMMLNSAEGASVTIDKIKYCKISTTNNSSGIYMQYTQINEILSTQIYASSDMGRAINTGVSGGVVPVCNNHIGKIDQCDFTSESSDCIYTVSKSGYGIGSISNSNLTGYHGGIRVGGGDVGDITDVNITQTYQGANNSSDYGGIIASASNGKIGNLTNVTIDAQGLGIYLGAKVTAGDFDHITVEAGRQDTVFASGSAIYMISGASINSISNNSTLYSEKSYGIVLRGAGTKIVENISDSTINGSYMGIYNSNGSICGMKNVDVIARKNDNNQCIALYNATANSSIGDIVDSSFDATDAATSYAIYNNQGKIKSIQATEIAATSKAILNQRSGVIDLLKKVTATAQNEEALRIESDASIGTIEGGVYIGGSDAVAISSATLGSIKSDAVFYGKNGYAINNENENEAIKIEPDLTKEPLGNARYYGSEGVTNNNHIKDPDKDNYPIHVPSNQKYHMSNNTTEVDGFKNILFHYLTVDFGIYYDLNGGAYENNKNSVSEKYEGGTKIKINPAPTRKGYQFLYWQGSRYNPGDDYVVDGDHTFTAQWEKETTPTPVTPKYNVPKTGID